MKEYINLEQLTLGCVSGKASEWQVLGVEARQALDEIASLRSELARVKEAAELLGVAFAYGLPTDKPTTDDARRFARSCEAVMNNPTAAALVEQARKEKV